MTCKHINIKIEYMNEGHAHYGKRVCEDCKKFIRWIPKNTFRGDKEERIKQVGRLQTNYPLNEFEREFISSIQRYEMLTPQQQKIYQRIIDKYFQ